MNSRKYIHAAVSSLFVLMAVIQLNDPDPALWVTLYLTTAAVPAIRIFDRRIAAFWGMSLGVAIACLMVSFAGFVDFIHSGDYALIGGEMQVDKPFIESAREFLGTLIALVCIMAYRNWHSTEPSKTNH